MAETTPSRLPPVRPALEGLAPYVPGEQSAEPGTIKLNTNEFPYPAAPAVLEAIRREATDAVRVYPEPTCGPLRGALAERHGVSPDQIFVGNGSDEVLRLLVHAYGGPGRALAAVEPSYSLFPVLAAQFETGLETYPLGGGIELPEALFDSDCDVCLLASPNPPLGTVFPDADLRRLAAKPWLLVLDGAYIDFSAGHEPLPLLGDHPNLVLTRSLSKAYGLAGLRVGYAIAEARIIADLHRLRDSYNVNRISQAAALAALDSAAYYRARCREIIVSRGQLAGELTGRGFRVHPSQGNFVFARHPRAAAIYAGLKQRNILVRHFERPGLSDGLRITVGTPREIEALLAALDSLAEQGLTAQ